MTGKKDLTRIEDLSEFIHQDDEEADSLFDNEQSEDELPSLGDLNEDEEEITPVDEFPFSSQDSLEQQEEKEDDDPFSEKTNLHELADETEDFHSSETLDFDTDDSLELGDEDPFENDFSDDAQFSLEQADAFSADSEAQENEENEEDETFLEQEETAQARDIPQQPPVEPILREPTPVATPVRQSPEKFDDIRQFGESIVYGKITAGGNPPYSVMIQKIKFQEDAEDIAILLREIGLLTDDNDQAYTEALKNGALLVSQLGEYAAIFLAHKLRRFDLELKIGLSEEIHPSKNYEGGEKGLVRKENIRQNKQESLSLQLAPQKLENILLMTANAPEGYRVHRYLGVVTSHRIVDEHELVAEDGEEPLLFDELEVKELAEHHFSKPSPTELYKLLSLELRQEAMKLKANAVIGITFGLTPLIEREHEQQQRYKVTCTGNAAWLSGLGG
jgi:uncharacterized protein YbjQ (UPF0145 family)